MKTAIVLAGRHDITDEMYDPIANEFKTQGWETVIFYEPDWSARSVRKLVSDFLAKVPGDAQPLTLLGFSLGGMIALIASGKLNVENLQKDLWEIRELLCDASTRGDYSNSVSTQQRTPKTAASTQIPHGRSHH